MGNEVRRSGRDPEQVDDTRIAATPGDFIGYGSNYAFTNKLAPCQRILPLPTVLQGPTSHHDHVETNLRSLAPSAGNLGTTAMYSKSRSLSV